jgi:hypothetical protein
MDDDDNGSNVPEVGLHEEDDMDDNARDELLATLTAILGRKRAPAGQKKRPRGGNQENVAEVVDDDNAAMPEDVAVQEDLVQPENEGVVYILAGQGNHLLQFEQEEVSHILAGEDEHEQDDAELLQEIEDALVEPAATASLEIFACGQAR